jgi:hypothetical protein
MVVTLITLYIPAYLAITQIPETNKDGKIKIHFLKFTIHHKLRLYLKQGQGRGKIESEIIPGFMISVNQLYF